MSISEDQLREAASALRRAAPGHGQSARRLDLTGALQELDAWIRDDREASSQRGSNWATVLDDVLWTARRCGPRLLDLIDGGGEDVLGEIAACRATFKQTKGPPDRAKIRRTGLAAANLRKQVLSCDALYAAFEDVINIRDPERQLEAASLFVALAGERGHDRHWFPSHLRRVMNDEAYSIAVLRDTEPPDDLRSSAGTSPEERLALLETMIRSTPARGDVTVWLRFDHARLGSPPVLSLGDSVTLFDDRWIHSVLDQAPASLAPHAPEVAEDGGEAELKLYIGDDPTDDDHTRSVYVRVAIFGVTGSEGLEIARRTADAIAGMASLYGTRPRLWELDDSNLVMTDNGSGGSSHSAPGHVKLDIDDQSAVENDRTGGQLAELADRLAPHLPVTDPAISAASDLLSWLRSARTAPAPARLLLCARVVEQVAGWAGFGDPYAFSADTLRPIWAVTRVRNAVSSAAFEAADNLGRSGKHDLANTFVEDRTSWGGTVNLKRFLEQFEEIRDALEDGPFVSKRAVERIAPHLESSKRSAVWLESRFKDFERNEARRRRTRNSLVHGGPLASRTVEATVDFAETLAAIALGDCIEGRLANASLVDHFLEQKAQYGSVERRLRNGEPLSAALFWSDD